MPDCRNARALRTALAVGIRALVAQMRCTSPQTPDTGIRCNALISI